MSRLFSIMNKPQTNSTEINIEGLSISVETVSNIDDLFEELLKKGDDHEDVRDEKIPYWADLWPSAIALSNFIVRNKLVQSGSKVLELGCGIGLPGIVAGKMGAQVVFTDYIQEALDLAKVNWSRNNNLDAEFVLMDWRNPLQEVRADIILASDIAYEKKSFEHLLRAFRILLHSTGKMFVSEPNRAFSQSFFKEMEDHGFKVNSSSEKIVFRNQTYLIHVHEIMLNI